jgi:hypothetical protein
MVVDSHGVDKEALLGRVGRLAVAARNSGAIVIHVVVGFFSFRRRLQQLRNVSARYRDRRGAIHNEQSRDTDLRLPVSWH